MAVHDHTTPAPLSRRALLATAPALALLATTAAALPAPALAAHPDAELLERFLSFVALEAEYDATPTEPAGYSDRWEELWDAVTKAEAETPAGILAKLSMSIAGCMRGDDAGIIARVIPDLIPIVEADPHPLARRVRNAAVALIETTSTGEA